FFDQRCCDPLPTIAVQDRQIVDVELRAPPLELGEKVTREPSDNLLFCDGGQCHEGGAGEQVAEVFVVRLSLQVGLGLFECRSEDAEQPPHQGHVALTEPPDDRTHPAPTRARASRSVRRSPATTSRYDSSIHPRTSLAGMLPSSSTVFQWRLLR